MSKMALYDTEKWKLSPLKSGIGGIIDIIILILSFCAVFKGEFGIIFVLAAVWFLLAVMNLNYVYDLIALLLLIIIPNKFTGFFGGVINIAVEVYKSIPKNNTMPEFDIVPYIAIIVIVLIFWGMKK